jgi:hypothetical protein
MHADFGQFSDRSYEATFWMRDGGSVVAETDAAGGVCLQPGSRTAAFF